jgi:hypothetical protein
VSDFLAGTLHQYVLKSVECFGSRLLGRILRGLQEDRRRGLETGFIRCGRHVFNLESLIDVP